MSVHGPVFDNDSTKKKRRKENIQFVLEASKLEARCGVGVRLPAVGQGPLPRDGCRRADEGVGRSHRDVGLRIFDLRGRRSGLRASDLAAVPPPGTAS